MMKQYLTGVLAVVGLGVVLFALAMNGCLG